MRDLLSAAQMGAIERAAIESGHVTGRDLMERAGRGAIDAVFARWPELDRSARRAVVLCGPGNNGGDGFVMARILKDRGWDVALFLMGTLDKLPSDARRNADLWAELARIHPLDDDCKPSAHAPDLIVDALFGTGLSRPVEGLAALFDDLADLRDAAKGAPRVVSVDIPSGLCSDSGRILVAPDAGGCPSRACIRADLTVTFHSLKPGHHLADGPGQCGAVEIVDIGLDTRDSTSRAALAALAGTDGMPPLLRSGPDRATRARLHKAGGAHKYGHGHALILSGGAGATGAARLAARAALRIGAGLVTLGVPPAAQQEVACQVTALMLRRVEDGEALAGVLADPRINALCLGPGLGTERARALVPVALEAGQAAPSRAVVLDADALTAFTQEPERLFGLLHGGCVLTPHGGEFARLFPDLSDRLEARAVAGPAFGKVDAVREAARRAGCVVLLKGADTVIAAPDGRAGLSSAQYARSVPWLATAGAGDVLAGFITGLLARGLEPQGAAELAAWLHVECARAFGPGLIAEDLADMVPRVLAADGAPQG